MDRMYRDSEGIYHKQFGGPGSGPHAGAGTGTGKTVDPSDIIQGAKGGASVVSGMTKGGEIHEGHVAAVLSAGKPGDIVTATHDDPKKDFDGMLHPSGNIVSKGGDKSAKDMVGATAISVTPSAAGRRMFK